MSLINSQSGRSGLKPVSNWKPFEDYNNTDPKLKADKLAELDIHVTDPAVLGILTKSNFVIPGSTRFECTQCGECCRYARKIATLTYEPCMYLTKDNKCSKHENNYLVCKWFPFWIYSDPKYGDLLTIKPYCSGYGNGKLIDYNATIKKLLNLGDLQKNEGDGASVIHEVLYLPEKKGWFFPSRHNIDELLQYIKKLNSFKDIQYKGELHYAQHQTSGLLGSVRDPQLTINEKGFVTDVNEPFASLSKTEVVNIIGKQFSSFFLNKEYVDSKLSLCFSKGKLTSLPLRLLLPDKSTLNIILNGISFRDRTDGLIHSILVTITPISTSLYKEAISSQGYARNIIEASIDSMMTIDIDGVITDVNEACCSLFGYLRDEIQGSKFNTYFDNPELALTGVELTYEREKLKNFELNLIDSRGLTIPVSFNASVFKSNEGVPLGVIAIARDNREIKKLFSEIEAAKLYARGLIESSIDMMLTIDMQGIITDVNEAFVSALNYDRKDITGSEFRKYFINKELATKGVELTFSQTQVRNYALSMVSKSGVEIKVSFNASLYKNQKNEVQGIFAIARIVQ
jgi:PAS domain S-box-containing protein